MSYIVNADIGKFLNITLTPDGQTLADSLIAAVDAFIDSQCNRTWTINNGTNIVETFDGGYDTFFPKQHVKTIVSITENGATIDPGNYFNYGYYIRFKYTTVDIPQTVIITYKTDDNALPVDLKQAEIQWIADMFKSSNDAGKVTSRVSMGPISVDFLAQDGIPKFVQMIINKYRLQPTG